MGDVVIVLVFFSMAATMCIHGGVYVSLVLQWGLCKCGLFIRNCFLFFCNIFPFCLFCVISSVAPLTHTFFTGIHSFFIRIIIYSNRSNQFNHCI